MLHGTKWATGFHRHACILGFTSTLPPPTPDPTRPKNVQVVTWGIGRFLIYLNATIDPDVYERFVLSRVGPLLRLWPLTGQIISWPPAFFVTDAFVDDLSNALEDFISTGGVILPNDVS